MPAIHYQTATPQAAGNPNPTPGQWDPYGLASLFKAAGTYKPDTYPDWYLNQIKLANQLRGRDALLNSVVAPAAPSAAASAADPAGFGNPAFGKHTFFPPKS